MVLEWLCDIDRSNSGFSHSPTFLKEKEVFLWNRQISF